MIEIAATPRPGQASWGKVVLRTMHHDGSVRQPLFAAVAACDGDLAGYFLQYRDFTAHHLSRDIVAMIGATERGTEFNTAIWLPGTGGADQLIGLAGLKRVAAYAGESFMRAELYVWISKPFRRRGYGNQAVAALTSFALHVRGIGVLAAHVRQDDKPAAGLFAGVGYERLERSGGILTHGEGRLQYATYIIDSFDD